jgi:hypothetical protein
LKALIRLSRESELHPACLTLTGTETTNLQQNLVSGGNFADTDIYPSVLNGQRIAVKMLRIFRDSDIDELLKV